MELGVSKDYRVYQFFNYIIKYPLLISIYIQVYIGVRVDLGSRVLYRERLSASDNVVRGYYIKRLQLA